MRSMLVIFVDGLPYEMLRETEFLGSLPFAYKVKPGVGYSINLHAELFSGVTADQIGIFNEWQYDPESSQMIRWKLPAKAFDKNGRLKIGDRALHVLLRRLNPAWAQANIPFKYQHLFRREKRKVLRGHFGPFFAQPGWATVVADDIGERAGRRDLRAVEAARKLIERGQDRLFLSLCDLDHYGHVLGPEDKAYKEKVRQLDSWIAQLCEAFVRMHPQGVFVIVSDHGMAQVRGAIDVEITSAVEAGDKSYYYFVDATMIRVWVNNENVTGRLHEWFESVRYGRTLNAEERSAYGITSRIFGDYLFLLEEGLVFRRNFLFNRIPKGMHGYHPDCPSQAAVFLSNRSPRRDVRSPLDVYEAITSLAIGQ